MRLSLLTKNEKHFFTNLCTQWLFFVGKANGLFILLVNTKLRFFSMFIQFWKNLVTKNVISANLAIPGLQFEGLGSRFLPGIWASLDMKGQEYLDCPLLPALPTVLAKEEAGKYPGTCTEWSFAWQLHTENRCWLRIVDYHATRKKA